MKKIYDSMVSALRDHWKANANAYPQRFELTQATLDGLVSDRRLVNETMNFPLNQKASYEQEFLGVTIEVSADGNVLVALNGERVPLGV